MSPAPKPRRGSGAFGGTHEARRGHRGVPVERLRAQELAKRSPAGVFGHVAPLSRETLLRAIESQVCPWCGKGPFKMLPVHTNKVHGVDKWEFRELAGLTTKQPLIAEEVRQAMREANQANGRAQALKASRAGQTSRRTQRWTSAGRAKNQSTLVEWEAASPDQAQAARRKAGRSVSSEGRARQREAMRVIHATEPERAERFRDRMQQPETASRRKAAIAAAFVLPEHGTVARYKHRCRCEPCREAKRFYRQKLAGEGP